MSESAKYVAIDGTELIFRDNGTLFMGLSNLRHFSRTAYLRNNRIYSFKKEASSVIPVPIYITSSDTEYRNKVFEVFERDVLYKNKHPTTKLAGRIYIGDYFLPGFFCSSEPGNYLVNHRVLKKTMSFVTDAEAWLKEEKFTFIGTMPQTDESGLDYSHDYPMDYRASFKNFVFENNSVGESKFEMIISGPIVNPSVAINDNIYNVDVTLSDNEFLTIDSFNKQVFLTASNGSIINCFNERNRGSNIFEPIAAGTNVVTFNQSINMQLTLIHERSEPEWI